MTTSSALILAFSAAQWIFMLRPAPQEQNRRAQARHSKH